MNRLFPFCFKYLFYWFRRQQLKIIILFGTWLCCFICPIIYGKDVLPFVNFTTKNGITVIFQENHNIPIVDIQVTFDAGFERDGKLPGIANLTRLMLSEATYTMGREDIERIFNLTGALYTADVDANMSVIHLRSMAETDLLNKAVDVLAEIIAKPKFNQHSLDKIKNKVRKDIDSIAKNQDDLAYHVFYSTLYKNLPYGHSYFGDKISLKSINFQDIQEFYDKYYVVKNAFIVIVGDLSLIQAKSIAEKITSKLKSGDVVAKPVYNPQQITHTPIIKKIPFLGDTSTILVGQAGVGINSPDLLPLLLANYILSASYTQSILFQELRAKHGLVYAIDSDFEPLRDNIGSFSIYTTIANENVPSVLKLIRQDLTNFLYNSVTDEDFARYKNSFANLFHQKLTNNYDSLKMLNQMFFYQLGPDYFNKYQERILALSKKQVTNAFHQHINANNMLIIMVGGS